MDAVTGLPVAIEPHSDAGARTGRGGGRRMKAHRLQAGGPTGGGENPARLAPSGPTPTWPGLALRSPADQRGDDHAPGGAAAVGIQMLLALAPSAAQPEGVEEQEEEVQGEAGQRGGPQQQQRLWEVGRRRWRGGRAASSAAPLTCCAGCTGTQLSSSPGGRGSPHLDACL